MVRNTVDECLQRQIAKKIFKSKIAACPVNAGHYMASNLAFHLRLIWLQTLIAVDSESRLTFESEQTSFPGRLSIQTCCFAQDSIQNMWFCSYVIFLLRDQQMLERLREAMGDALVGNNFLLIPKLTCSCLKFTKH